MRFIQELIPAAVFSTLVAAVPYPLEPRQAKAAFTVEQTVAKPFILSGPAQMAQVYAKFGKPIPEEIKKAAANNDGTVTTTPTQFDSQYLTPVTIGGQTLNLDFDTGSSDLWVFSTEQPAAQRAGHDVYDPSKSKTAKAKAGYTWSIRYGDGSSSSGNVYTDVVKVGQTTVSGQAVELAKTVSGQFVNDKANDGLLGLAFDNINTVRPQPQKTFFSNAINTLSAPLFTADLKKGQPGTYGFGKIDNTKHTGSITYVPVISTKGFWEFTSNGYAVGNSTFKSTSIDAIADTGTTLLYLPDAVVKAYYAKVPGAAPNSAQGGYTYACGTALPSITLGVGTYKAVVPGNYINYAPIDASGTTCFGGIQSDTGIGFSIWGDIFLKSQFVVFEGGASPRLGFAPKRLVGAPKKHKHT